MNNEIHSVDDLHDDNIDRSLRQLGLIFPKTQADFEKIEREIERAKQQQPDRLKDPFCFLEQKKFKSAKVFSLENHYSQNLSQAAREGKTISEEIKKKMEEDKIKSGQKKKDN